VHDAQILVAESVTLMLSAVALLIAWSSGYRIISMLTRKALLM
jgi:hypothetical protein